MVKQFLMGFLKILNVFLILPVNLLGSSNSLPFSLSLSPPPSPPLSLRDTNIHPEGDLNK